MTRGLTQQCGLLGAMIGVLALASVATAQTAAEKEALKKLGKSMVVFTRRAAGGIELCRHDFDGNGGVNTRALETGLGDKYIGLNRDANMVCYFKQNGSTEFHGDIWLANVDGTNKRKISKRVLPWVGNLKFMKLENKVLYTSGDTRARPYGAHTGKLWMMDLDGNERLILDYPIQVSSSSYKYLGDTQIYGDMVTYRYDTRVYLGKLPADTSKKQAESTIDFGKTCEQDFGPDGDLFITNNTAHTGVNIHRKETTGTWTKNIKAISLFSWKTDEYRWTNNNSWIVANPEATIAKGANVFNWETGGKIRITFEDSTGNQQAYFFFGEPGQVGITQKAPVVLRVAPPAERTVAVNLMGRAIPVAPGAMRSTRVVVLPGRVQLIP